MTSRPQTEFTSYVISRYERSPLEFEGLLVAEHLGWSPESTEPQYRIRVYQEASGHYVLEMAIVVEGTVVLQLADFAESLTEVDDLLCLLHEDTMDGFAELTEMDEAKVGLLDKRLEAELDRQSILVMKQLNEFAESQAV